MSAPEIVEERRDAASHAFAACINLLRQASHLPEYATAADALLDAAIAIGNQGRSLIDKIAAAEGPTAAAAKGETRQ